MAEAEDRTVVGSDSKFVGELTFENSARIIGTFEGKIQGKGELNVVQNAQCKADVEAGQARVDGIVEGNLSVGDTVHLNANGMVRGNITAKKMVMQEGASFFGQCEVGEDKSKGGSRGGGSPQGGGQPQQGQGGEGDKGKK